jgi:hypothetical protein
LKKYSSSQYEARVKEERKKGRKKKKKKKKKKKQVLKLRNWVAFVC